MERDGFRIASVRAGVPKGIAPKGGAPKAAGCRLGTALLVASPRVAIVEPGLCRTDARGWTRRGGEEALARALRRAAEGAGFAEVRVGVADAAVAADAAAALAVSDPVVVPPGKDRSFLAPLPLAFLPLSGELRETFRALGLRRIEEVARLERRELEARFGPEGLRVRRLSRGEDDRVFRPLSSPDLPEARVELDGPVAELEPLLFVLRHLVGRVGGELAREGRGAARLALELDPEGSSGGGPDRRRIPVAPPRPTAREDPLFDLCRAALERELGRTTGGVDPRRGRLDGTPVAALAGPVVGLAGPVAALALRVVETAPTEAPQGDLFRRGWRDPLAAAATLSRLRARVGEEGVVRPAPRSDHRPETRSGWVPVEPGSGPGSRGGAGPRRRPTGPAAGTGRPAGKRDSSGEHDGPGSREPLPPALRLLLRPAPLEVRVEGGRPASLRDGEGRRRVTAAEGPERLSGDWWGASYGREYWRLATADGELLWAFREGRGKRSRWWLHGWWD